MPMKNFFISYNHADEAWANWIAWVLERAGSSVIVQAWDFRPGANFVLEMQKAAKGSLRTIAVLSQAYLDALYTQPEWASAFAGDPTGDGRHLVPVRVAECDVQGLLGPIVYIDLVGRGDDEAERTLLAGLQPGRAKPTVAPPFPGPTPAHPASGPAVGHPAPGQAQVEWRPLAEPLPMVWQQDVSSGWGHSGPALLELHIVPVSAPRVEVRRLAAFGNELTSLGRQFGLFTPQQGVSATADGTRAAVMSERTRNSDEAGLLVTRAAQVGVWFTLSHDGLGAVFDPQDLRPRLEALLDLLMQIPVERGTNVSVAAGLSADSMVSLGSVADIVHRSEARMSGFGRGPIRTVPDEAVAMAALRSNAGEIAEEVIARLSLQLQ